jgi:large subunit ribosomal protein L4
MKLAVRNAEGKELRKLDVDDSVFGVEPNESVLHQAFVAGRNNQRAGTAQTKTRGEVQGSTRKIRRQKYTGRARQGSIRAPHHVGGGVVFGPVQRSYAQALPKKMRRLAIRSALSGKVADGQLVVIDQLDFESPRTKEIIRILRNVGIERSTLVVTSQSDRMLMASIRNLPKTKALPAAYLNVVDMLNHQSLLITEEAVRIAEQLWGKKTALAPAQPKAPARRAKAAKEEPKAEVEAPARRAKAAKEEPKVEVEAPAEEPTEEPTAKPSRARRPTAKAEERPPKEAKASAEKPVARARTAGRSPKAEAEVSDATEKPAPRRRTRKASEGEG